MAKRLILVSEFNEFELKEFIATAVQEALQKSISQFVPQGKTPSSNQLSDKLLSRKEVCKLLSISEPTLVKLQRAGQINAVVVSGSYKYSSKHIQDFINGKNKI